MNYRFFIVSDGEAYQHSSDAINAAMGFPTTDSETTSLLPSFDGIPSVAGGRLLSMSSEYHVVPVVAGEIDRLLACGAAVEISEAEFFSAIPTPGA
jgi:hypothetical protein